MTSETIISILLGIGLAASVGFRVFLPLFILSLAAYLDFWQLNENWIWLGSMSSLLILGVATIAEILAYYIPFFDNILDTIAVPLAAIAGSAVMLSTVANLSPEITWALAIIAGGGTAAAISSSTSTTRLTSTSTTAGLANPIVSTLETGASLVISIISVILPVLGFILVLLVFYVLYKFYKKFKPSTSQ